MKPNDDTCAGCIFCASIHDNGTVKNAFAVCAKEGELTTMRQNVACQEKVTLAQFRKQKTETLTRLRDEVMRAVANRCRECEAAGGKGFCKNCRSNEVCRKFFDYSKAREYFSRILIQAGVEA